MTDTPTPHNRPTERDIGLVELDIAALASGVRAPESLHRRVQEMAVQASAKRASRWRGRQALPAARWRLAGGAATATCAAAAAATALVLAGGGSPGLSVQQAAALTLRAPSMPAPRESRTQRDQLAKSVEGVAFPYWREQFGWRSEGARIDHVAGRTITTVFYSDGAGRWIGYAIASGRTPKIGGGTVHWHSGIPYRVSSVRGATVVAWPRDGHLCVVSGRGMSADTLVHLAAWTERT
jgi:hypothetical protein